MKSIIRIAYFLYGAMAYTLFLATFVYALGFLTNLYVPKSIDSAGFDASDSVMFAVAANIGLLLLFAVQHSGMARLEFKEVWTRIVPAPVERATYVLFSSLVLAAVMAAWTPIGGTLWHFESGMGYAIGLTLFSVGVGLVLYSTVLIDHFELFGLRQVFDSLMRKPERADDFVTPSLYRYVRHPLYVGWFITLWATPSMSMGHLLFASVCTTYVVIAVHFEELDLIETFGDRYRQYRETTPMFVPRGSRTRDESPARAAA